jgi:N-methylhydantoinase A
MRKRPALTMLSGPTASVIGALMYLRASDGIYFEVGGTSTNIGVIKSGRPTIKYAQIGPYRTYISSLDVRVLGVAGGSMVRVHDGKLVDVGPRSAHIAGMGYAAFTPLDEIVDPKIEFFQPKEGDTADYVAIRLANGKRITITNTCAANVLGLIKPEWYSCGNRESCVKAMTPLAEMLGLTVEKTAQKILEIATDKLIPVVEDLIAEYKLDKDQAVLVGAGGGAATLMPFTAGRMQLNYQIPLNAEVISSIGVALAMVRDVVERVIPNPTTEDIEAIKREAKEAAIKVGANPDTVEVFVEIDTQTQRVRAVALGATELKSTDLLKECTLEEAKEIAAQSMKQEISNVEMVASTDSIFVFSAKIIEKGIFGKSNRQAIRVVDKKGFIKVQRGNAMIVKTTAEKAKEEIGKVWDKTCQYRGDGVLNPDLYVIVGGHVMDVVGMINSEQAETVAMTELQGLKADDTVIIIGSCH